MLKEPDQVQDFGLRHCIFARQKSERDVLIGSHVREMVTVSLILFSFYSYHGCWRQAWLNSGAAVRLIELASAEPRTQPSDPHWSAMSPSSLIQEDLLQRNMLYVTIINDVQASAQTGWMQSIQWDELVCTPPYLGRSAP
jgi:hypothetical protein